MATADTRIRTNETAQRDSVAPPVDVYENSDEILLVADLPGVADEGLGIELDRGELRLHGSREGRDYRRVFTVPDGIDNENVRAELKQGVLYVHMPKSANIKPRRVTVSAA